MKALLLLAVGVCLAMEGQRGAPERIEVLNAEDKRFNGIYVKMREHNRRAHYRHSDSGREIYWKSYYVRDGNHWSLSGRCLGMEEPRDDEQRQQRARWFSRQIASKEFDVKTDLEIESEELRTAQQQSQKQSQKLQSELQRKLDETRNSLSAQILQTEHERERHQHFDEVQSQLARARSELENVLQQERESRKKLTESRLQEHKMGEQLSEVERERSELQHTLDECRLELTQNKCALMEAEDRNKVSQKQLEAIRELMRRTDASQLSKAIVESKLRKPEAWLNQAEESESDSGFETAGSRWSNPAEQSESDSGFETAESRRSSIDLMRSTRYGSDPK